METRTGLLALTKEELNGIVEQYPWCSTARLLLWDGEGELPSGLLLRQSFHRMPDYLKKNDSETKPQDSTLSDIIDRFLTLSSTRIDPSADSGSREDLSVESVTENYDMVSEELAEIYTKQGLFREARKIYERLSLLYPEKSVYFAEIIAGLGNRTPRTQTVKKEV